MATFYYSGFPESDSDAEPRSENWTRNNSAYHNGYATHPCFGAPPDPFAIEDESDQLDLCRKNLIVNYLPQYYTDKHLHELFIPFGPLHSVKIMRDGKTGYSYGFGFVNYLLDNDAKVAKEALNGCNIANKRLKVSFARPSCDEIKDSNCYIRNLPQTITDDEFVEMFGKFGTIVQKKLLRDKRTGFPRGTAFVRFANRDQASACISFMNHHIPPGSNSELRVKLAQDHGRQKAAYIAGFQDAITRGIKGFPDRPQSVFFESQSGPQSTFDQQMQGSQSVSSSIFGQNSSRQSNGLRAGAGTAFDRTRISQNPGTYGP